LAKSPTFKAWQALDLVRKLDKDCGRRAVLVIALLSRAIELDPKLREAYLGRANARWGVRESMLRARITEGCHQDVVRDHFLADIYTAAAIAAWPSGGSIKSPSTTGRARRTRLRPRRCLNGPSCAGSCGAK
jgi:hypothetical protein